MSRTKHHGQKAKERSFGKYWQWLQSTPSWWTKITMLRPQRMLGRVWQSNAKKTPVTMLDDIDKPSVSKKPHHYYW